MILVNNASVAGPLRAGDDVIIGGLVGFINGAHRARRDDRRRDHGDGGRDPLGLVQGRAASGRAEPCRLKRRGASRADIHAREMLARLGQGSFRDEARQMSDEINGPMVREVLDFILALGPQLSGAPSMARIRS